MSSLIECVGLSVGYGKLAAIRDVELHVNAGEIVALLGSNGAGKTTTLLGLAGFLRPMSGQVLRHGVVERRRPHQRVRAGMAFVPQDRALFSTLSAGVNLKLGRGDVETALGMFPELKRLVGVRAGLLSGGEQQMLTLARALASGPDVLLIDEMSMGLAPVIVRRLLGAVAEIAATGVGVLLVEQHARVALEVADRAYVLQHGRIAISGEAPDLLQNIGTMEAAYFGR